MPSVYFETTPGEGYYRYGMPNPAQSAEDEQLRAVLFRNPLFKEILQENGLGGLRPDQISVAVECYREEDDPVMYVWKTGTGKKFPIYRDRYEEDQFLFQYVGYQARIINKFPEIDPNDTPTPPASPHHRPRTAAPSAAPAAAGISSRLMRDVLAHMRDASGQGDERLAAVLEHARESEDALHAAMEQMRNHFAATTRRMDRDRRESEERFTFLYDQMHRRHDALFRYTCTGFGQLIAHLTAQQARAAAPAPAAPPPAPAPAAPAPAAAARARHPAAAAPPAAAGPAEREALAAAALAAMEEAPAAAAAAAPVPPPAPDAELRRLAEYVTGAMERMQREALQQSQRQQEAFLAAQARSDERYHALFRALMERIEGQGRDLRHPVPDLRAALAALQEQAAGRERASAEQIRNLQAQLRDGAARAQAAGEAFGRERDELNAQLAAARTQLAAGEHTIAALREQIAAAGARVDGAQRELAQARGRIGELEGQLERITAELAQARRGLAEGAARIAELEARHEASRALLAATEERAGQAEARAAELDGQLDQARRQQAASAARIAELDADLARLRAQIAARDRELEELRQVHARCVRPPSPAAAGPLEPLVDELEANVAALEEAGRRLENDLDGFNSEPHSPAIDVRPSGVAALDAELAQLRAQIAETEARADQAERQRGDAQVRVARLEQELAALTAQLVEARQTIAALRAQLAAGEGRETAIEHQMRTARERLRKSEASSALTESALRSKIARLARELAQAGQTLAANAAQMAGLREQLAGGEGREMALDRQLREAGENHREAQAHSALAKRALRGRAARLTGQLARADQTLAANAATIAQLRQQAEHQQRELQELRAKLEQANQLRRKRDADDALVLELEQQMQIPQAFEQLIEARWGIEELQRIIGRREIELRHLNQQVAAERTRAGVAEGRLEQAEHRSRALSMRVEILTQQLEHPHRKRRQREMAQVRADLAAQAHNEELFLALMDQHAAAFED